MATKKTKTESTAMVPWEAEMAAAAESGAAKEKPTGSFKAINVKGGIMTIDDAPVPGNSIEVVVLAGIHENQFFAGAYTPGATNTPVCYAFGDPESDDPEVGMAPHAEAPDKQHSECGTCPMNEWGSADVGRGKACKNVRRLALISVDSIDSADDIEQAEVRALKIPVTSVKNWGAYVRNKLPELRRPCYGVKTRISVTPDAKTQFKMSFTFAGLVDFDGDTYAAMKSKVAGATKDMLAPYPVKDADEAPKGRGGGKVKLPQTTKAPAKKAKF